ncbi:hypothetical protein [uncultured Campylobacter sp.]|uniref:hypothetical protein n=1 Tax=uncultured Campylobacter sp. TaxID=218934 RepID=UPI00260C6F5D|nr:hypothetical protein [uncultured Campylobacter sp.]
MDQSRLDELKKPLQKRHQEPKWGSEQNSNGENFKAQNSEIQNSEVSNFEARNSEVSNFEAQNSEVSNSKFLNYKSSDSEVSNFEILNSEPPNFATDALNLEAEADQNSACDNNAEPQNFISDDSGALPQNSKARDYDEDSIIIKNYEKFFVYSFLVLLLPISTLHAFLIIDCINYKNIDIVQYFAILFIILLSTVIISIFTVIRPRQEIKFTNKYIQFISDDLVEKRCEIDKNALSLNFSIGILASSYEIGKSEKIFLYFIAIFICVIWWDIFFIAVFFTYLFGFLLNFILYLFINRNLKGFRALPFIRIARPSYGRWFRNKLIYPRYYLVYLYNQKIYDEIKEYFLRKSVNINNVKKDYLFI